MIPKKTTKMIVKDGSGNLVQLLPEIETASTIDASSDVPVSNAALASALEDIEDSLPASALLDVMEEEPTALNTTELDDEALIVWMQPESWSITIDTEADTEGYRMGQIPFCLYGVQNASMTVDWGDGTVETYTSANAVENTCPTHQYATAGEYTIRMESDDFSRLYLWTSLDGEEGDPATYVATLKSINESLPQIAGVHGWYYNEDTDEEEIGDIDNTFYGCFEFCSSLQSIPSGLFDNNTAVTSFQSCFRGCTSLQSIPSGLFDYNTAVTSFYICFYDCSFLQSIPSGLFDKNTLVTTFDTCFFNCRSLQSIPEGLFDNNTAAASFSHCFGYCTSLQSIPSGLFDKNVAVTDFSSCFYNCRSIQSIPSGLFDKNVAVKNFGYCFSSCSSLQSIPSDLFDNNTAATNFGYCFYQCSALTDFTLHIGSSSVFDCSSFVSKKSGTTRTIYVPSGSTTQTTFNAEASSLGLTIIGE